MCTRGFQCWCRCTTHHFVWCLWWECCLVWSPLMEWCEWAVSSWASCKWERSAKDKYKILAQWTKMYHLVSDQGCHSQRKGQSTHENFLEQAMSQFWLTKLDGKLTIDTGSGRDSRNCPRHVPHCVRLSVQEWKWRKSYHRSQMRTWGACQLVFWLRGMALTSRFCGSHWDGRVLPVAPFLLHSMWLQWDQVWKLELWFQSVLEQLGFSIAWSSLVSWELLPVLVLDCWQNCDHGNTSHMWFMVKFSCSNTQPVLHCV